MLSHFYKKKLNLKYLEGDCTTKLWFMFSFIFPSVKITITQNNPVQGHISLTFSHFVLLFNVLYSFQTFLKLEICCDMHLYLLYLGLDFN